MEEANPDRADDNVSRSAERDVACHAQDFGCVESGDSSALLVSAIVSTYNCESLIGSCLDDLVNQSLFHRRQLEIVVIDSGSEQNEKAVVENFQRRYGNISYLRTERETIYAAWNRAIRISHGRYVTNANTDDAHRQDALEKLAAALEAHPDAALAYADFFNSSVPNDSFANPHIVRKVEFPPYQPASSMFYCVTGCHPMWRRSVFEKIGFFDSSYRSAGDYEFVLRLARSGLAAIHIPEALSLFYENPKGIQFSSTVESYREFERIREKYRTEMPIERLFSVDASDYFNAAPDAWVALGNMAMRHTIPWFEKPGEDLDYAVFCCEKALRVNERHEAGLTNLIIMRALQGRLGECKELFARLPALSASRLLEGLRIGKVSLVLMDALPAGQLS